MISYESIISDLSEFAALGKGQVGDRRRQFVQEYVADPRRNASRAYAKIWDREIDATARANASKLLTEPNISAAIKALENKIRDTALPRILNKLEAIIHSELPDVMTWDGEGKVSLIPSDELPPAARAALAMVQEVREEKQGHLFKEIEKDKRVFNVRQSVKMHDPVKAIEVYAKLAGIGAAERIEISGLSERLERARERVANGA